MEVSDPLWFKAGWWTCERSGSAVAKLGNLARRGDYAHSTGTRGESPRKTITSTTRRFHHDDTKPSTKNTGRLCMIFVSSWFIRFVFFVSWWFDSSSVDGFDDSQRR
jgi:hypothetical protein